MTILPTETRAFGNYVWPTTRFFLMFGRQIRLPVDLMYGTSSPDSQSIPEYVKSLQHTLQEAHQLVREKCQAEHSRQKMLYDRRVHGKTYQVGDMVVLHSCVIPRGKCRKLHNPWTGPVTAQNVLPENCPADRLWQPNLVRDQIWLPYLVLPDRMWLPYSVPPCHIMSARGPNVASIFCPVGPYMAAIFGPGPNVAATFGPGPNVSN